MSKLFGTEGANPNLKSLLDRPDRTFRKNYSVMAETPKKLRTFMGPPVKAKVHPVASQHITVHAGGMSGKTSTSGMASAWGSLKLPKLPKL